MKNQRNKNGERHGFWVRYWYSGNLMYKGYYNNGVPDGIWVKYWENGNLQFKRTYDDGKLIGYITDYNSAGEISKIGYAI